MHHTSKAMFAFAIFFAVSHWMLLTQAQPLITNQYGALLTLYDSIGSFLFTPTLLCGALKKKKKFCRLRQQHVSSICKFRVMRGGRVNLL
jgi:hypothetical protein